MTNWDAIFFVLLCVSVLVLVLVDERNWKLAGAIGAFVGAILARILRNPTRHDITLTPDQTKREQKHGDTDAEIRALDESAELLPDLPDDVDRAKLERLRAKLARHRKGVLDDKGSGDAD